MFGLIQMVGATHEGASVMDTKTTWRFAIYLFYLMKYTQYRKQILNPNNNGQACLKCCDDPKGCSDTKDPSEQRVLHLPGVKLSLLTAISELDDCVSVVKGDYCS
jgi:hypothetical protein